VIVPGVRVAPVAGVGVAGVVIAGGPFDLARVRADVRRRCRRRFLVGVGRFRSAADLRPTEGARRSDRSVVIRGNVEVTHNRLPFIGHSSRRVWYSVWLPVSPTIIQLLLCPHAIENTAHFQESFSRGHFTIVGGQKARFRRSTNK
jgi:hypothetical protein